MLEWYLFIDTFIWDEEEILNTSFIYDGEDGETSLQRKYEFIDPLKNLRSILVSRTKELSLVILRITKLCLLYLFGCMSCRLFTCFIYQECHEL